MMIMPRALSVRAVLAGMLSLVTPHHGMAQWTVSAGIRLPRFSGAAVEPEVAVPLVEPLVELVEPLVIGVSTVGRARSV